MNVGIVGCGGMGAMHAQMATNCGLKIVACADKKLAAARALAKPYGAKASSDCRAVIKRPDVDIVGIMTPTPTHAQYVIAAARAGKHIFCEKPFGRTVRQCQDAIAAAMPAGRTSSPASSSWRPGFGTTSKAAASRWTA